MSAEAGDGEDQERLGTESFPQMELLENNWSLLLLQNINMFRLNGTGCDVILLSEDGATLEAHSLVLKAGSPYFKQVLETSTPTENKTVMQISSPEKVLSQMLEFLYTGRVVVDLAEVQVLKHLAVLFKMATLEALCDQCGFGLQEPDLSQHENEESEKMEESPLDCQIVKVESDASRMADLEEEESQTQQVFVEIDPQTQVPAEDAALLAQVAQGIPGQIHVIQQEASDMTGHAEGEEREHIVLDILPDMLAIDVQNTMMAKSKPSKLYRYKCGYCERQFSHKYRLKGHQATAHFGRKAHKCHLCDKSYSQLEYLKDHMAIHNAEKKYECRICLKKFQTMRVMKKHVKTHKDRLNEKFKCQICSKVMSSKTHLQKHLVSHSGEKHYQCDECDKSFMYQEGLIKHKRTHVLGTVRECSACKEQFASQKELNEHIQLMHPVQPKSYQCDICGKAFVSEGWRDKHKIDVHAEDSKLIYKCQMCGSDFTEESLLRLHQEAVHKETEEKPTEHEEDSQNETNDKNMVFPCGQCNKVFKRRFALKEHLRTHSGEKPYSCSYCSKAYASSSNLRKHERAMHSTETLKDMLDGKMQHQNREELVQMYKCGVCSEKFSDLHDLREHVIQHQRDISYSCEECKAMFMTKYKLQDHVKDVHTPARFVCDICQKEYIKQNLLASHYIRMHDINKEELRAKMVEAMQSREKREAGRFQKEKKASSFEPLSNPEAGLPSRTIVLAESNVDIKMSDTNTESAANDEENEDMHVLHVREISEDGTIVLNNGQRIDTKDYEMATVSLDQEEIPLVLVPGQDS